MQAGAIEVDTYDPRVFMRRLSLSMMKTMPANIHHSPSVMTACRSSVISYQGDFGLKVVKCNDAACTGGDETITTINDFDNTTGINTSIAIGADSFPVISYQEASSPPTSYNFLFII